MPTYDYICENCGAERRAHRSADSPPPRYCDFNCRKKAGYMNLRRKRKKWPISPEMHDAIKRVYHTDTGNGQVAALAKRFGYPRQRITKYAIRQGWIAKQKGMPHWSEKELKILKRNARYCPEVISRKMKEYGFSRSATAIVIKRKKMRYAQNLNGHSARSVAICLGVDVHYVTRAIKSGQLYAMRRGTNRTERQGGDAWWIKDQG